MEQILEQYGLVAYGLTILFGGTVGTKLMPGKKKFDKFFLFSLIIGVLFIGLEVFVQKTFEPMNATKYLFTFAIVCLCYQRFIKTIFVKWGLVDEDPKPTTYKAPADEEQQNQP